MRRNAICVPSGDQTGVASLAPVCATAAVVCVAMSKTSTPLEREYMSFEPSGEKRRFEGVPLATVNSGAAVPADVRVPSESYVSETLITLVPLTQTSVLSSGVKAGASPSPSIRGTPARDGTT